MITIKNVKTLDGQITHFTLHSAHEKVIEAEGRLLLFPGVIDPHICLGSFTDEKWKSRVQSTVQSGITTIVQVPNTDLSHATLEDLTHERKAIDKELSHLKIPLRYLFYAKGNPKSASEIGSIKKMIQGIVISNDLLATSDWDTIFQMTTWQNLPLIVYPKQHEQDTHTALIEKAIHYAEKQSSRLVIFDVANQDEIDLIQEARARSLLIYAETTPQYLFRGDSANALWEALNQGVIEMIGSGYCPLHPLKEKITFQDQDFSVSDPLFLLPRLMNAVEQGKISIEKVAYLTHFNVHSALNIENAINFVLIDLDREQALQEVKNGFSQEIILKGWPAYTIIEGEVFPSAIEKI